MGERIDTKQYMGKLYAVLLFYQMANALILPIVPYYAKHLEANSLQYTLSFTLYYITMLISSLGFGWISDRYGRRIALSVSLIGISLFTGAQIFVKDINWFIVLRFFTGLFDCQTALFQACVGDVTTFEQRAYYLSQLEAVANVAQAVGPIIGGILSAYSLTWSVIATAAFYVLSAILAVLLIEESLHSLLEKKKILANLQEEHLSREEYNKKKESLFSQMRIQEENQLATESSSLINNKKWKINYVMGIALVGEFCCRWLINVFDVTVSEYGEEQFDISSMEYSFASGIGSIINVLQTGWLYTVLLRHNVSIPIITSFTGIAGAIGILLCVTASSKAVALIGSLFFIIAYGFSAPTAPTVMSTESTGNTQGVAAAMVLIGGQSAYILIPSLLGGLYALGYAIPFLVSIIPCVAIALCMIILNFIPGGRTSGQVPLRYALESLAKETKIDVYDNEMEEEAISKSENAKKGSSRFAKIRKNLKKNSSDNEMDVVIEMTSISKKDGENDDDFNTLLREDNNTMDHFNIIRMSDEEEGRNSDGDIHHVQNRYASHSNGRKKDSQPTTDVEDHNDNEDSNVAI